MTNLQLLKRSELLAPLLLEDISFILTRTTEKSLASGEVLFHKGAIANCFFVVKAGKVAVFQKSEDNTESILAEYVDGDSFGEFDFIIGGAYKAEARALTASTLLIFPTLPYTLENLTTEKPDTVTRLYLQALILLSSRVNSMHKLISENTSWVKQFQEQLYRDHLTGLYTKYFLNAEIPRLLKPPVAILILKPDHFKELNDIFGHKAGDAVLHRIGQEIGDIVTTLRLGWAVRLRSNEIAVVLQNVKLEKVPDLARVLVKTISRIGPSRLSTGSQKDAEFSLTTSMAIGYYEQKTQDWNKIFNDTYQLMYQAWKKGGNKIYLLKTTTGQVSVAGNPSRQKKSTSPIPQTDERQS